MRPLFPAHTRPPAPQRPAPMLWPSDGLSRSTRKMSLRRSSFGNRTNLPRGGTSSDRERHWATVLNFLNSTNLIDENYNDRHLLRSDLPLVLHRQAKDGGGFETYGEGFSS